MPADPDPLAGSPSRDARAHSIDDARDLMARDSRISDAWKPSLYRKGVAVADPARLDLDPDVPEAGLRNVAFDQL
jgi:hypothetical protein